MPTGWEVPQRGNSPEFRGTSRRRIMPLMNCPDCGKEISSLASACIHCGRPLARPRSSAGATWAVLLPSLWVAGGALMVLALFLPWARGSLSHTEWCRLSAEVVRAQIHLEEQIEAAQGNAAPRGGLF